MADEEVWKKRFAVFAMLRLSGLALFFLGVAIAFSDLVQDGGWPLLGAFIAASGLIDAIVLPKIAKRAWKREDEQSDPS